MTDSSSHHLISAYVDDRLSPEERAEVEALLQSSAEARKELDSNRQLRRMLQALPTEPAPADLLARVMAQAEQESLHGKPLATVAAASDEKGGFRKRWAIPAVSVVTTLGLALLVMIQFNSRQGVMQHTAAPDPASGRGELASTESSADATERDRSTIVEEAVSLDPEIRHLERNLSLSNRYQFTPEGNTDGTIMLSDFDLRTADVGNVIEALQVRGDRVAVVRLMVLDRQRFLDNFHVLLSDLEVPEEARGVNTYDERQNDYLAVFVEAGEGRFKELMANLQQDMDIAQMYVSTTIPSTDLNSFVAKQGYSDLWGMNQQNYERSQNAVPRAAAVALNEEAKEGERNRIARPFDDEQKMAFAGKSDDKPSLFRRAKPESEFPPPPPLPLDQEILRAESQLAARGHGSADMPALKKNLSEELESKNEARRMTLRIPAPVGKELTAPRKPDPQVAISKREAADRQLEKQKTDALRQPIADLPEAPSSAGAGAVANASPKKPAAPLPEPAAEPNTEADAPPAELASPTPGAGAPKDVAAGQSPARDRKRATPPIQVLFLLSTDNASAVKPVPPAPAEAKQAPKQ